MHSFNTTDPVSLKEHYCVPPLSRIDPDQVCGLIQDQCYFVLHAPRHTGKTSVLWVLRDFLNSGEAGDYRCVYVSMAIGFKLVPMEQAMRVILSTLAD